MKATRRAPLPSVQPYAGNRIVTPLGDLLDILLSAVLLAWVAPVLLATALAVAMESRPSILIARTLREPPGRAIVLWEFRTGLGRNGEEFFRVGRFLWEWRLSQLPMLCNVLRGDIS